MQYRLNPYRTAIVAFLVVLFFIYHKLRSVVHLEKIDITLEEFRPIHGIVIFAMICIALAGILKLWFQSKNNDDQ